MSSIEEVSKLNVNQLKVIAAEHNIEVASDDKKGDLVRKVADGTTPEQLEAYTTGSETVNPQAELAPVEPAQSNDESEEVTPEEQAIADEKAEAAKKAAEEAARKEEEEAQAAIEEQKRLEEEAKSEPAKSNEGSEIANAIVEGLKDSAEAAEKKKKIRIVAADKSVVSRFSLVRDKSTREVLLRENETGHLSKIQLESLEEKEASIQNKEVEEL